MGNEGKPALGSSEWLAQVQAENEADKAAKKFKRTPEGRIARRAQGQNLNLEETDKRDAAFLRVHGKRQTSGEYVPFTYSTGSAPRPPEGNRRK